MTLKGEGPEGFVLDALRGRWIHPDEVLALLDRLIADLEHEAPDHATAVRAQLSEGVELNQETRLLASMGLGKPTAIELTHGALAAAIAEGAISWDWVCERVGLCLLQPPEEPSEP